MTITTTEPSPRKSRFPEGLIRSSLVANRSKPLQRLSSTLLAACLCLGAINHGLAADLGSKPGETPEAYQARMQWWRHARFGMFIHWGPVTLTGDVIGWSRGGERRDGRGTGNIPPEIYDQLYRHFNPSLFDAREWVRVAQAAGMKYLVFTTKHHDGFNLFDTKFSDYKITSAESPFGRDVATELLKPPSAGVAAHFPSAER